MQRHAATALRTWREQAAYRRAAAVLFADARMLPGAEMLKRWRHHRHATSRLNEAFDQARRWTQRAHMHVALMCFKRVYAAENSTGALISVASGFMREIRIKMAYGVWSKLSREFAAATHTLRVAVSRWSHQALAFCFCRMVDVAVNHQVQLPKPKNPALSHELTQLLLCYVSLGGVAAHYTGSWSNVQVWA